MKQGLIRGVDSSNDGRMAKHTHGVPRLRLRGPLVTLPGSCAMNRFKAGTIQNRTGENRGNRGSKGAGDSWSCIWRLIICECSRILKKLVLSFPCLCSLRYLLFNCMVAVQRRN